MNLPRVQGKNRMATGPFKSPFYLVVGGPQTDVIWIPQAIVVVSNDDHTTPAGGPFFTLSVGQGDPTVPGGILTAAMLVKATTIPGAINFAALNIDLHMHYGDIMWLRIGGAPAAGTPFTAILHYQAIIPAGREELNVL